MKTVLLGLYNLLASMGPGVQAVLALASLALSFNSYLNSIWSSVFTKVGSISSGSFLGVDFSAGGFQAINTVFPLDTLCTLLSAYLVLLVACTGIRMLKAWLPTVSG